MMQKVFVLGIDGGSLSLITRWKNFLPNFSFIIENGTQGTLESCVPPITSPAWNCMFTGKNPAKIGIFDFVRFTFDDRKVTVVNSSDQDACSLWDILGRNGHKVAVFNVPTTFPPKTVNGLMVCGGLLRVLSKNADFTYPPNLRQELDDVVGDYETLPLADISIPGKEEEYLAEYTRVLNKQTKSLRYLMEKYPWDFMTYVIFNLDQVQHYYWHHMDKNHPKWHADSSRKYASTIKDFYVKIDEILGNLLCTVPKETNVFIVSDHGFGPLYGDFCINEVLKNHNFLKMKERNPERRFKKSLKALSIGSGHFLLRHISTNMSHKVLRLVPKDVLQKFTVRESWKNDITDLLENIDWAQTKAFGFRNGIFINLKMRNPYGIISPGEEYERIRTQIIETLLKIRHPSTGRELITKILKKEELYSGKYVDQGPDLVYFVDNMRYRPIPAIDKGGILVDSPHSGEHRMEGLFMAYGPDIEKGGTVSARIYDIVPTILHIFGIPIPRDIDGKVLTTIFKDSSRLHNQPLRHERTKETRNLERKSYSDLEEQKIKERLRNLGYL